MEKIKMSMGLIRKKRDPRKIAFKELKKSEAMKFDNDISRFAAMKLIDSKFASKSERAKINAGDKEALAKYGFIIQPKFVKLVRIFSDQELLKLNGELLRSAISMTKGALCLRDDEHVTIVLDRLHMNTYPFNGALTPFINQKFKVIIASIQVWKRHTYVFLSARPFKKPVYDELKAKKQFTVKLVHFMPWGAYGEVNGLRINISNNDSVLSTSSLEKEFNLNDEVEVKVKAFDDAHLVLYASLAKPITADNRKVPQKDQKYLGKVKSFNASNAWIKVPNYYDIYVRFPQEFELNINDPVIVKVNYVNNKTTAVGRIVKLANPYEEEKLFKALNNEKLDSLRAINNEVLTDLPKETSKEKEE